MSSSPYAGPRKRYGPPSPRLCVRPMVKVQERRERTPPARSLKHEPAPRVRFENPTDRFILFLSGSTHR